MAKSIALTIIAMLAMVCVASPLSEDIDPTSQIYERKAETHRLQSSAARVRRSASLPEDQREFMSRQILQALSEILQREDCVTDYQGWVDFGRRNTD